MPPKGKGKKGKKQDDDDYWYVNSYNTFNDKGSFILGRRQARLSRLTQSRRRPTTMSLLPLVDSVRSMWVTSILMRMRISVALWYVS